jgi:probable F420-dependent oxidoreductase
MKFGVPLGVLRPNCHTDVTIAADELGFESVWLPEHLIFPVDMSGSPHPGSSTPPVPPETPVFDAFAYLCYLAGRTSRIRLGTNVYLPALRHPFVFARAVQTLDLVSNGRAEIGIGTGWLATEYAAAGIDFKTRGRRTDEILTIARRLWTEEAVAHKGTFYEFEAVKFEPKPIQSPHPPLHIGGESDAALRRAVRFGAGWVGLAHTIEDVREPIARLEQFRSDAGVTAKTEITVMGKLDDPADIERWQDAGVDRLIVAPWKRSSEAVGALRAFADRFPVV